MLVTIILDLWRIFLGPIVLIPESNQCHQPGLPWFPGHGPKAWCHITKACCKFLTTKETRIRASHAKLLHWCTLLFRTMCCKNLNWVMFLQRQLRSLLNVDFNLNVAAFLFYFAPFPLIYFIFGMWNSRVAIWYSMKIGLEWK